MTVTGAERLATLTVSFKRPPVTVGGKRGTPTTFLTGIRCTPLDPVDPEVRFRLAVETPHEILQTFVVQDADIKEGDVLVTSNGVEYPVKSVGDWTWTDDTKFLHLYIEDLKR
jgi:hypothetical protein